MVKIKDKKLNLLSRLRLKSANRMNFYNFQRLQTVGKWDETLFALKFNLFHRSRFLIHRFRLIKFFIGFRQEAGLNRLCGIF